MWISTNIAAIKPLNQPLNAYALICHARSAYAGTEFTLPMILLE